MDELQTAAATKRLLDVIEHNIVPLTRQAVTKGIKLFGAAVLGKSDLALVVAGSNNERENPLWHGEIATLKAFYDLPSEARDWLLNDDRSIADIAEQAGYTSEAAFSRAFKRQFAVNPGACQG